MVTTSRKTKRVQRYANIATSPNTYKIGKTKKMVYDLLPERRPFTQREVRLMAKERLNLFPSEADRHLNALTNKNFVVPLRGRKFKKGTGKKVS